VSAWEKYEENLVGNFPTNYEYKKEVWSALQMPVFHACLLFCCWSLESALSWIPGE